MTEAHLVGSVNLPTATDVFTTAATELGSELKRIPDGETGSRVAFVASILPALKATPELEEREVHLEDFAPTEEFSMPLFAIRDDVEGDFDLARLGYADWARASYAEFSKLADDGIIPSTTRFQVSIPGVHTFAVSFSPVDDQERMLPVWRRALATEVADIVASIPADRLSIQWDVPAEVGILERFFDYYADVEADEIGAYIAGLASLVPEGVEVGYHFCYGDAPPAVGEKGRHWKEPDDLSTVVVLANALFAHADRPIDWIHLPVPIDRDDDAYFAPLADLAIPEDTALFVGLVHEEDGAEGAQRRIESASKYVHGFGVSTECGLGREPQGSVPGIMALHRDLKVPA